MNHEKGRLSFPRREEGGPRPGRRAGRVALASLVAVLGMRGALGRRRRAERARRVGARGGRRRQHARDRRAAGVEDLAHEVVALAVEPLEEQLVAVLAVLDVESMSFCVSSSRPLMCMYCSRLRAGSTRSAVSRTARKRRKHLASS